MTKNHLLFTGSRFFPMAFAIASAGGCASSAHDNGDSTSAEDPLTGGALVRSDTTPAIYIYNGCSAVKVSPRHLLTAGHCVLMHGFSTGRLELDTNYTPGTVISMSSMRITPSPTIGPWFVTTILQTDIHPAFRAACIGQLDCDETVDPYPSDLAVIT